MSPIPSENTIISITVSLFMLSLVTEKISNILKLWIPALAIRSQDGSTEEITRDRGFNLPLLQLVFLSP